MRSVVCVSFVCHVAREKFESMNNIEVVKFLKLLKRYDHLSKEERIQLHELYIKIHNEQKEKNKTMEKVLVSNDIDEDVHYIKEPFLEANKSLCGQHLNPINTIHVTKIEVTCTKCLRIAKRG